mmetsp:Transcript_79020/g.189788  ORF Transcript_79020/g.189788 Transcript_79020/m.189788 type:complete len:262 (-) Transcript_79020:610-1395(-)
MHAEGLRGAGGRGAHLASRLRPCPAENVQVQDRAESYGQVGAIVLQVHAAQGVHCEEVHGMQEVGQDHQRLCGTQPAVLQPSPARDGGGGRAQVQEQLHQTQLPPGQRHVKAVQGLGHGRKHCDAICGRGCHSHLRHIVSQDKIAGSSEELVDSNAHADPREGVVGLPEGHGLPRQLHVPELLHAVPHLAAHLGQPGAAALEAPGVHVARLEAPVCGGLCAWAALIVLLLLLLLLGRHEALLLARHEGDAEHLLALQALEL